MTGNTDNEMDAQREDGSQRDSDWTEFGYSFACLFMALLLFAAPRYFSLKVIFGSAPSLALSLLCYAGAIVFAVFVFSFASTGFDKHPELKVLLPSFMGREDAWQGMFGAATFFAIAASTHWVAMTSLGATGIVAFFVKLIVYVFLLFGVTQVAQALDGFIVRPLLSSASEGQADWDLLVKRVRRAGTVIGSIVAAAAALLTILDITLR